MLHICGCCGATAEAETPPLTWVTSLENGRTVLYCEDCARRNVRGIEGRLDSAWW